MILFFRVFWVFIKSPCSRERLTNEDTPMGIN